MGLESVPDRFWRYIVICPISDCWEWRGAKQPTNYGVLSFKGKQMYIHRVMWALFYGPIPKNMTIDHLCRNRSCCNPEHLEPVTITENRFRARKSQLPNPTCINGHEYTPENTYVDALDRWSCIECRKTADMRYHLKKKGNNND